MSNAELARKIAEAQRAVIREEVARAMRAPTGVIPGTYGRVSVDIAGRVVAGVGVGALIAAASRSTPQSISNATTAVIDFDHVIFDPNGYITTGAGWVFTAPFTGYYQVLFGNLTDTNTWSVAGREINAKYAINGSGGYYLDRQWPITGSPIALFLQGVAVVQLAAGDTFAINTYQNSGASLQTGSAGDCFVQFLRAA